MAIFRRVSFNILAFFVGTVLFGMSVLFFSQYNKLTASVSDAFVNNVPDSGSDIDIKSTMDGLYFSANREFTALDSQSLRISFLYNPLLDISSRSLVSQYPHSISLQDGEGVILITLDKKRIKEKDPLVQLISPVHDTTDQVVVQSIQRYSDTDTQDLQFYTSLSLHH